MKTIIINLTIILVMVIIGFQLGLYWRDNYGDNRSYTEKMQDCMSQGGKYYLSMEEGRSWNYEKCEIEKEIIY